MKRLFLCIALALSAFTFTAMVQAVEGKKGFAPISDHAVIGGGSSNIVAIADCDRCMYAGLNNQEPLIAMNTSTEGFIKLTDNITAWTGPFEVGWRS